MLHKHEDHQSNKDSFLFFCAGYNYLINYSIMYNLCQQATQPGFSLI